MTDRERKIARTKKRPKCAISYLIWIESLHMTPRRPYWCSKTMKRQSCWCSMLISCGSWTLFLGKRIFFPINLHKCYPPEWKRSIRGQREWMDRENGFLHVGFVHCCFWLQLHSSMIFSWLAKIYYINVLFLEKFWVYHFNEITTRNRRNLSPCFYSQATKTNCKTDWKTHRNTNHKINNR